MIFACFFHLWILKGNSLRVCGCLAGLPWLRKLEKYQGRRSRRISETGICFLNKVCCLSKKKHVCNECIHLSEKLNTVYICMMLKFKIFWKNVWSMLITISFKSKQSIFLCSMCDAFSSRKGKFDVSVS